MNVVFVSNKLVIPRRTVNRGIRAKQSVDKSIFQRMPTYYVFSKRANNKDVSSKAASRIHVSEQAALENTERKTITSHVHEDSVIVTTVQMQK